MPLPQGYEPRVVNRSGEILGGAITSAAGSLAGGIEKWQTNKKERDFLNSSMDVMAQRYPGLITPDVLEKFHNGSLGAQRGIFTGLAAQAHDQEQIAAEDRRANREDARYGLRHPEFGSQGQTEVDLGDQGTGLFDKATGQHIGTRTKRIDPGQWKKLGEDDYTVQYGDQAGNVRLLQKSGGGSLGRAGGGRGDPDNFLPGETGPTDIWGGSAGQLPNTPNSFSLADQIAQSKQRPPAQPKAQTITMPDGKKMSMVLDPNTGQWVPVQTQGAAGYDWDTPAKAYQ
jgi:hypothetical protein